jgi:uncharacterized protein (TIGR00369 family)
MQSSEETMPVRTYEWETTDAGQDFLTRMPGIEYCRRVLRKEYPASPIFRTMGIEVDSIDPGASSLTMQANAYLMHGRGILHGGALSTLLDTAMAWAALSIVPQGGSCATIHLTVDFVRPVPEGSGSILAEGRVVNAGRRVVLLEAKATVTGGKLVAGARSTCLISDRNHEV